MPWTLLFLVLLWYRFKLAPLREPLSPGSLLRFGLVWFLTVFIGLSLASAKRPIYLGPIYPPFALLAALGWDSMREKFLKIKNLELYGLIAIFLVYIGAYQLFIIPSEKKQSLRPVFEAVSSQQINGPVYLVNPSETTRGASFFYLEKRIPVLTREDLLLGRFEDRAGTTLVIDSLCDNNSVLSDLLLKGYRPLLQKEFRKNEVVCVYSNSF
jgi:hypothetical protein